MPTLIIAADSATRIAGTSPDDLTIDDKTVRLTQPEFNRLPTTVLTYPHNWNANSRLAETVFNAATYRTLIIETLTEQAATLKVARFSSSALGIAYDYDVAIENLIILIFAAVSRSDAMLVTYTGETVTERNHSPEQQRGVTRSYFDTVTSIKTRIETAVTAINAATTQTAIDAVTL